MSANAGPGHLRLNKDEADLYRQARCAWCAEELPTDGILRLTCSERCRRARSRARHRAEPS